MNQTQVYAILNSIAQQATGRTDLVATDTSSFVSVANTALKTGYDNVINAISQVLSKTIFSVRPYSEKFKGLEADSIRYGNHIRKISQLADDFEEDERLNLVDGQAIDHYKVKKPKTIQMNFYDQRVFARHITRFKDQLDVAFSSENELARFWADVLTEIENELATARESMKRMTLANMAAGKAVADSDNVVYLLDLYESETGATGTTPENIRSAANFKPFADWLFGFLQTESDHMTENTVMNHMNPVIGGVTKNILRHTPTKNQKLYLFSDIFNHVDSAVLANTFNSGFLKLADHERVSYWQSPKDRMKISVKPSYMGADGTEKKSVSTVTLNNVLGMLFDEEAAGVTTINTWQGSTPMNVSGGYFNTFFHQTIRWWNDLTENCRIYILDHAENAINTMTVTMTDAGGGKNTVTPSVTKQTGEGYKYKIGDTAEEVHYGEDLTAWTDWNGSAAITIATGKKLSLAIVDADHHALTLGVGTAV